MEHTVCDLHATELLKFKTFELKVFIHCQGCKKKVKKVVQNIEGVYKTEIDALQHKVVVTGSIDAETVINQLLKKGKQAQIWPQPINNNIDNNKNTNNNIDNKSGTINNQEERISASTSTKSKKNDENKQEIPPINEAEKKNPAEKTGREYDSSAEHSKNKNTSPQTNHADKAPIENKSPTNNLQLVRPTDMKGVQVASLGGDGTSSEAKRKPNTRAENGGKGNNNCEAEKKQIKKAEIGEGRITNAPPPLKMAEHFPPPSTNVAAPPGVPVQAAYQPMIPAEEYREVMSCNNTSSYSTSSGGPAFYAPPPLKMAEHFPPPSNNVVAPPDDLIQAAYQPMIPVEQYREVMSYNNTSSYSTSSGGPAFYAPPLFHHSYTYFGPPTNGYYPPPPPDPIRAPTTYHNDYYSDYHDENSGCSIM